MKTKGLPFPTRDIGGTLCSRTRVPVAACMITGGKYQLESFPMIPSVTVNSVCVLEGQISRGGSSPCAFCLMKITAGLGRCWRETLAARSGKWVGQAEKGHLLSRPMGLDVLRR